MGQRCVIGEVVDCDQLDVRVSGLRGNARHAATDATETVDCDADWHESIPLAVIVRWVADALWARVRSSRWCGPTLL